MQTMPPSWRRAWSQRSPLSARNPIKPSNFKPPRASDPQDTSRAQPSKPSKGSPCWRAADSCGALHPKHPSPNTKPQTTFASATGVHMPRTQAPQPEFACASQGPTTIRRAWASAVLFPLVMFRAWGWGLVVWRPSKRVEGEMHEIRVGKQQLQSNAVVTAIT